MRPEVVIPKSRLVASGDLTTEEQSWRIRVILKHPNPCVCGASPRRAGITVSRHDR